MSKHIDKEKLNEISAGNKSLISDLLLMFTNKANEYATNLDKLVNEEDFEQLAKLAHKIKGSVATLGMIDLSDRMKDLEAYAKANRADKKIQEIVDQFKTHSKEAIEELNMILQNEH